MAAHFVNNTTFEGAQSYDFYKALLDSEFSSRSEWTNVSSIKNSVLLPSMSISGMLTEGVVCDWTATGTASISRKEVTVCPYYVNYEVCKKDIEATFLSARMKAGQMNGEVGPSEFTDFLVEYIKESVATSLETQTWAGLTSSCEGGLVRQAQDDSTVVDVVGITASFTAANVIAEVIRVIAAVPAVVLRRPDFVIYAAPDVVAAFRLAIAALVGPYAGYGDKQPLNYAGYTIKETPGLSQGEMFATHLGNLFNVNDLSSDEQRVSVIDMSIVGEQKARIAMAFKYTATYGVGAEVVLYT